MLLFGVDAVLNYKAGGISGGGSWTELKIVADVELKLDAEEYDNSTRASGSWKSTIQKIKDASVEFELDIDNTTPDPALAVFRSAFLTSTSVGLQILDKTAGEGLEADFSITNFSKSQPLKNGQKIKITAKLTYVDTQASWISA